MSEINSLLNKLVYETGLGIIKQEPVRVSGGLLNRMYKIVTDKGIYAIKHLNPEVMKRPNAKNNHIVAEQISNMAKENGVCCIPAIIFNGSPLQEIDNNYFLIFEWFEGKPISENAITDEQVIKVAKLLAKIHNIDFDSLKEKCTTSIEINEIDLDFYISKIDDDEIKELLLKNKDALQKLDKQSTEAAKDTRRHLVISHRDLDLPNILWNNDNNPVIIDWESAGFVSPEEELIETAWDWSGGQTYFDKNKFDLFIDTYKTNGGHTDNLEKAIYANFKNKSGWLEYNLKRVCGIECIDEEEKQLGKIEVKRVIKEILFFYETIL